MGEKVKTSAEITEEVNQLTASIVGKINSLDSKNDRANLVQETVNSLVAGVELSRIEKVGILYTVTNGRVKQQGQF